MVLVATLPAIIAVNWDPKAGKNQLEASAANIMSRLKKAAVPGLKPKGAADAPRERPNSLRASSEEQVRRAIAAS